MSNVNKKLFGTVPVELEETEETYSLTEEVNDIAKSEINDGLRKQLNIYYSYLRALPDTENSLTKLNWDPAQPQTNFTLTFSNSPLFDLFKEVISSYSVQLDTDTDQPVLQD